MQKNVPEVHARVGGDGPAVGRGVEAHGVVRAVQRPPHAAVVRQPARHRVPPDAGPADRLDHATHLVLDLDPPDADGFDQAVAAAHLVHQALDDVGLAGAVKTSGAKGVHVFVPIDAPTSRWRTPPPRPGPSPGAPSSSIRRSPRPRSSRTTATARCSSTRRAPAAPRSSPPTARGPGRACRCRSPSPGTISTTSRRPTSRSSTAAEQLGRPRPVGRGDARPRSALPADLIAEGHEIPVARVAAMHEGKRRARARRDQAK